MPASGSDSLVQQFKRHQHLAREGEAQRAIFRLEAGWACRYRLLSGNRRQIIALFLPGEYCEPEWFFSEHALHPVVALTDLRARGIPLSEIRAVPSDHYDNVRNVLSAIVRAAHGQAEWIVSLGRKTAIERLSTLICEIFDRMRANSQVIGNRCPMPLTQYDLADIVGLTPVHVNRVLQTLRSEGLVELTARWLTLTDPPALRALASASLKPRPGECDGDGRQLGSTVPCCPVERPKAAPTSASSRSSSAS